ncbi:hypothetical protein Ppa06_58380 [Planomonospora parontospora subsp. parontospora]|uniref:Fibronectin type-III domain-containing protein n=2 Tax=Planomonospora parontospora TaxID=58119 RepID=A0AA37F787_9ACTN|nr:fibronectin type III domain-containing protein [Planomonospora parontospora]GGK91186.1 hypothetical protein GCM10010126_58280 [Planomonospora parontospora]GII12040.1 hypothetical protein Ppa06_58380 [Planomonospora parontospora subsp. parontospora]
MPLNDVPSLRISYSAHAAGAQYLTEPCEVALEYSVDGGPWAEAPDGRFLRIKRTSDQTDITGVRTYTCPGWAWQLHKLVLYPGGVMADGKRIFSAATPGAILRTFITEGKARGTLPGLATDFTTTHDSAGTPWGTKLTLSVEPGMPLLTLLINLAEQGIVDWQMQGRTLRVFREGTALARNLAAGPDPVDLRLGRDIIEAPDDATLEDAASAILVTGEPGLRVEVTNPAATVPWGRWETYQQQGGVTDHGTATLLGQAALARASGERVQITRGIIPHLARWLPWADYRPGDRVLAPGDGAVMQPLRVRQITLTVDVDGQVSGNLVLNDRFVEGDIKRARQAAGILAGGVSTGGSGRPPAPEAGGRAPAAPADLLIEPVAYIGPGGIAAGQITATWTPTLTDTAGVALDIDGYELFARRNEVGELWHLIAMTGGGDTTATYSPLEVGWEYAFKVRATSRGVKGVFSEPVAVEIPDDAEPPPVPSAPLLSTRLGVITVAWDGLTADGQVMPADFARVRIWMRDPLAEDPAAAVDYLDAAGAVVVTGQPYEADREFFLTAVDRSGNESAASATAVIATAPLVDTDMIGAVIDGADILDGTIVASDKVVANSITGSLIQARAVQTGHLAANAVSADKIEAGAITAGKLAAVLTVSTRIVAGDPGSARVELNSTGVRGYDSGGSELVSLPNTGAFTLRSAASGPRVQLDTTGLRAFNSSGVTTVNISSAGAFTLRSSASGARIEVDTSGVRAFNASGTRTFTVDAANGEVDILGRLSSGPSGKRLVINPLLGADPEIRFYEDNTNYHYITSFVESANTLQIGTAIHGDRKGLIQLTPNSAHIGVVDGAGNAFQYGMQVTNDGFLEFSGRLGTAGSRSTFARGNASFPANSWGTVGFGFTFTGGTAFVVATMFNIHGPHGVCLNNRNESGFGFSTTEGVPGAGYDIQYFAWKQ